MHQGRTSRDPLAGVLHYLWQPVTVQFWGKPLRLVSHSCFFPPCRYLFLHEINLKPFSACEITHEACAWFGVRLCGAALAQPSTMRHGRACAMGGGHAGLSGEAAWSQDTAERGWVHGKNQMLGCRVRIKADLSHCLFKRWTLPWVENRSWTYIIELFYSLNLKPRSKHNVHSSASVHRLFRRKWVTAVRKSKLF